MRFLGGPEGVGCSLFLVSELLPYLADVGRSSLLARLSLGHETVTGRKKF